jgi:hypothetical protein
MVITIQRKRSWAGARAGEEGGPTFVYSAQSGPRGERGYQRTEYYNKLVANLSYVIPLSLFLLLCPCSDLPQLSYPNNWYQASDP